MKRYAGIDVGEHRLFAAVISVNGDAVTIAFSPATDIDGVLAWCVREKPIGVAIDAPPSHSLGLAKTGTRRVAEEILSIGGCYGTPPVGARLPGWMETGMRCHDHVGVQLGAPLDLSGEGVVFEVHPTYGFRSMLGVAETPGRVRCDPQRILRPKSPRGSLGHRQRVTMLQVILGTLGVRWTPDLSEQLLSRLDWTDAALSASLAVLRARGETRGVGNPREGTIVIADPSKMASLEALKRAARGLPVSVQKSSARPVTDCSRTPPGNDGADCALLRLGPHGLGLLSREDTIDALRGQLSEHQIVIPVGVRSIGQQWFDRAADGGFWLLVTSRGVVALALHVVSILGKGRANSTAKGEVLGDNRDPWPCIEESEYWFLCDALVDDLDEEIANLRTLQNGSWAAGVPANQTAWLGARIDRALADRLDAAAEAVPK